MRVECLLDHVREYKDIVSLFLLLLFNACASGAFWIRRFNVSFPFICARNVSAFRIRRRDCQLDVGADFLWDSGLRLAALRKLDEKCK
jgi:hypothetical protein